MRSLLPYLVGLPAGFSWLQTFKKKRAAMVFITVSSFCIVEQLVACCARVLGGVGLLFTRDCVSRAFAPARAVYFWLDLSFGLWNVTFSFVGEVFWAGVVMCCG